MQNRSISRIWTFVLVSCLMAPFVALAQEGISSAAGLSDAEKEQFLLTAKVVRSRGVSVGINNTRRLSLSKDEVSHDAHFNSVDISKPSFQTLSGTELNFKDCYKYNIAAYRLDRLIGLNMVPVHVERKIGGTSGSVSWWVDDVLMMELDRYKKKLDPPDPERWNDQMFQVRVFNELVYNMDPNLGNLLITRDWNLQMIDFTRAFRLHKDLRSPANLSRIDRRVYEGLKALNAEWVEKALAGYLTKSEMEGLLARRDRIVEFFNRQIAEKGEAAVVCDQPGH